MMEDIFLAYANNILTENPENYGKVIEEIQKQKFLKYLISPHPFKSLFKLTYDRDFENYFYHSDESKNNCQEKCYKWKWAKQKNPNLNCRECQQVFFIHILDEIVSGKKLDQIEGYEGFTGSYPVKKLYSRYKTAMNYAKFNKTEPEPLWSNATETHDCLNIVDSDGDSLEHRIFLSTFFQSIIALSPGWPPKIPHLWPLENPPPSGCF